MHSWESGLVSSSAAERLWVSAHGGLSPHRPWGAPSLPLWSPGALGMQTRPALGLGSGLEFFPLGSWELRGTQASQTWP